MRMMTKLIFGICIVGASSLFAESIQGYIPCGDRGGENINSVVVFVNGINNSLDDAEESRARLETMLQNKGVCYRSYGCVVEKYYNKTQGWIDDSQELNFVGDMERNVSNLAFRKILVYMNIDFLKFKNQLKRKANFPLQNYAQRDKKVIDILNRMRENAIDSDTDPEIKFSEAGNDVIGWLIGYLVKKAKLPSPYLSLVTTQMLNKKDFYNAKYKVYFNQMLKTIYMSERRFYQDDNIASAGITKSVEGLVTYLEELLLSGKKIVVVAHSQGNHIIELAYSILRNKWGEEAMRAIQVVGVAVVASTSPNDTYLTWEYDWTVNRLNDAASDGDQLKSNFYSKTKYMNWNNHSFLPVYMNPDLKGRYVPNGHGNINAIQSYLEDIQNDPEQEYPVTTWISGLIDGSLSAAIPYVQEITSGIITATLRWDQYDDMDLWTDENSQNLVYFNDSVGIFDSALDRDDRDGEGPEHYTTGLSCEELQNKFWRFGIQQYPYGGSPANAYFSIKVGNSNPYQKIYSFSRWSEEIQWISSIHFGEITSHGNLPYTLNLLD